jgi:hypothetical protein
MTFSTGSQSLAGNEVKIVGTPTVTIDNSNSISSVQVNFGNVETVWRPIFGYLQKTIGASNYDITCTTKYVGTTLTITILITDDTGLSNTIPAINFNFRVNTYVAPF